MVKLVDTQGLKPCPLRVLVQVQAQVQIIFDTIRKAAIITLVLIFVSMCYFKIISVFLSQTSAFITVYWGYTVAWSNFSILHFIFILNFTLILLYILINVFYNLLQPLKLFCFLTINLRRFHFLSTILYLTNTKKSNFLHGY